MPVEKNPLPPDLVCLLEAPATETDLRIERIAQLDDRIAGLARHLEQLAEIASRRFGRYL